MSGGQIGSVIGAAVGYYFGGPVGAQIGMAVGGYIGGAIDPTKIYGPKIGDGQTQSSTDGTPIAWVQGRARVAGTLVAVTERRQVKKKDSGKGSGTENVTFEAHQDFAIQICESSELRGTTVTDILRIEMDGKIVYDADPASPIHQDSLKFIQGVDFTFGAEDQQPHPTLEAFFGVGNTLAYRGYLVAVFKDFNLTPQGDRIPSFVFTLQAKNLNGTSLVRYTDVFKYFEAHSPDPGPFPPYDPNFDDSLWPSGRGGFGTGLLGRVVKTPNTFPPGVGHTFWLRKPYTSVGAIPAKVRVGVDDFGAVWWNGEYIGELGQTSTFLFSIPAEKVLQNNMCVVRGRDTGGGQIFLGVDIYPGNDPAPPPENPNISLADVVTAVCLRGGLDPQFIDTAELVPFNVIGYPIATQATASDCLSPLLAAYFCYASEYDGILHFRRLGADAILTVNLLDLIESGTGSDGASVISNQRNQETEYPRKITTTYYDPDQNYTAVTVTYERNSKDVNAIGEQAFQLPVVMWADDAMQATVKALKATWAALEGTAEYSLPIVGRGGESYLSVAAGDNVFYSGKRWVVEEFTIGHNMLHLKTTFNRQSAYTTNIQAIPSNPPIPPVSQVGGPTTLYPMNLPQLRVQDTYGLYLAVGGETTAWNGASVQISYDLGETWKDATVAAEESVLGALSTPVSDSDTSFGVTVNGELSTITSGQLAAQGNPWAILSDDDYAEVGQFRVATQTGDGAYTVSEALRGQDGTESVAHTAGDRFTMLDSVYFLPVDLMYSGKELQLRAITLGGTVDEATIVSIIYRPNVPIPPQPHEQLVADGVTPPTPLTNEDETDFLYTD